MRIELTMDELKCLALHHLGLQAEIKHKCGLTVLQTPHEIEVIDGPLEKSSGTCKENVCKCNT
jgi:hypothetical protein